MTLSERAVPDHAGAGFALPTVPTVPTLPADLEVAPARTMPRAVQLSALLLCAAAAALALSVSSAMATTVIGLILFGIMHNVLELRYVAGRFGGIFGRSFIELMLVLITGIVVCRLLVGLVGRPAQLAEIALAYAVLAVGAWKGLDGWRRTGAWAALAPAAVVSLAWPAYHFVVLTHLHNLVPLFFLWEWSRRLPSQLGRRLFRGVQVAWVLVVPLAILAGALDPLLSADTGAVRSLVGDGQQVLAASAPPGEAATVLGLRFLTVFAFMQTMHYVVWVWFLPRYAPDAGAALEAKVPWLTGPRVWAIGFIAAAMFAVILVADYGQGKALYAALASYHAYLEFPVLLALLAGAGRAAAPAATRAARTRRTTPLTETVH